MSKVLAWRRSYALIGVKEGDAIAEGAVATEDDFVRLSAPAGADNRPSATPCVGTPPGNSTPTDAAAAADGASDANAPPKDQRGDASRLMRAEAVQRMAPRPEDEEDAPVWPTTVSEQVAEEAASRLDAEEARARRVAAVLAKLPPPSKSVFHESVQQQSQNWPRSQKRPSW